jgi:hypothetical protein
VEATHVSSWVYSKFIVGKCAIEYIILMTSIPENRFHLRPIEFFLNDKKITNVSKRSKQYKVKIKINSSKVGLAQLLYPAERE